MTSRKSPPPAPSDMEASRDLLIKYLERKEELPSPELQGKRARLLKKLAEFAPEKKNKRSWPEE